MNNSGRDPEECMQALNLSLSLWIILLTSQFRNDYFGRSISPPPSLVQFVLHASTTLSEGDPFNLKRVLKVWRNEYLYNLNEHVLFYLRQTQIEFTWNWLNGGLPFHFWTSTINVATFKLKLPSTSSDLQGLLPNGANVWPPWFFFPSLSEFYQMPGRLMGRRPKVNGKNK